MKDLERPFEQPAPTLDVRERVRAIRARLPGQVLVERLETVRLRYGRVYTLDEVRRLAAETLPMRVGYSRAAVLDPIETYRSAIPDDALLKYDDAVQSGLFSTFWVVTPSYRESRQIDPWIVAQVTGTDLYAVVAQWP
ncbi:MAG TPA: hypothetical protein VNN07_16200 [Candidatus Tectomicrobia bacterium]|nr:hypothetical protein [Candidatus Tectomicrobia bacterium]